MPMDAVFLHGLTRELTQSLTGARIDKVQQPERDLLLLSVRTQGGNARLLVHGSVGSARVHFTRGTFVNPAGLAQSSAHPPDERAGRKSGAAAHVLYAPAQASRRCAHHGCCAAGF